jgi:uncharacterized protein with ParB-like and HNH nuclease domain
MFDLFKPTVGELFEKPERFFPSSTSTVSSIYRYCVPPFQRKYEWEKEKEVNNILNDILTNINRQYFIGPMILFPREDSNSILIEIIDGQQRLVTFALFFRALADYVKIRIDENLFSKQQLDDMQQLYSDIRRMVIRRKDNLPMIQLSKTINKEFEEILLSDAPNKE